MSVLTERFIELREDEKTLSEIAEIPEKICPVCGRTFCGHGNRKYCSSGCKKEMKRESERRRKREYTPKEKQLKYCLKCGKSFYGHGRQKFCSAKCGKAYRGIGRRYTSSKDERLKDAVAYDKAVNLHTLIKRDNNVCQICGGECDLYDYEVTSSGAMMCGDTYPTIDHIKPCALGGSHTWDNVQLACLKCNREKSDTYEI